MATPLDNVPAPSHLENDIFQFSPVGIVVNDANGVFHKANPVFLDMLGYSQSDFQNMSYRDITHPADLQKATELYHELISGQKHSDKIEVRSKTATGQWLWTSVNVRLRRNEDDSPAYFISYVEDVSKEKFLEEKQARTIEEKNALLDATRIALQSDNFVDAAQILYDHCRVLIGATCGYVAVLLEDKSENEVLFLEDGGLGCTVPAGAPMPIRGFWAEAYKIGKPIFDNRYAKSEQTSFFPEDHVKLDNVLFAPLIIESETIGLMGFAQKRGGFTPEDAQISGAFADLVAIVLKQSDIQKKNDQLKHAILKSDRTSSMGRLAAGICHELNNPLSYVTYSIDSLVEDLDKMHAGIDRLASQPTSDSVAPIQEIKNLHAHFDSGDMRKRLRFAHEGIQRIEEIAAALGRFSLTEVKEKTPIIIDAAVEDAINMSMYEIKYRAKLVKELGVTSPVFASPGRLAQCILNLILNAVESIDPGDVDNSEIRLRTWQEEGTQVFFQISDTGCGIQEETRAHVFEPFHWSNANAGYGLGLAICKQIVDELNGEIDVVSTQGTGTTVTMRLPMHQLSIDDTTHKKPVAISPDSFVQGRILLVDDEDGIRAALQRILHKHNTVEVQNGKGAIAVLEKDTNFDLVLCDLMMPKTSGIDVHKWIMAHVPALAEDVVFMTGGVFTDDAKKHLADFDPPVINKPFNRNSLSQLIDQHIANRHDEHKN